MAGLWRLRRHLLEDKPSWNRRRWIFFLLISITESFVTIKRFRLKEGTSGQIFQPEKIHPMQCERTLSHKFKFNGVCTHFIIIVLFTMEEKFYCLIQLSDCILPRKYFQLLSLS